MTDEALDCVGACTQLGTLSLNIDAHANAPITAAGMKCLTQLTRLTDLYLCIECDGYTDYCVDLVRITGNRLLGLTLDRAYLWVDNLLHHQVVIYEDATSIKYYLVVLARLQITCHVELQITSETSHLL